MCLHTHVLSAMDPAQAVSTRELAERMALPMPRVRGALGYLARCGIVERATAETGVRTYRSKQLRIEE